MGVDEAGQERHVAQVALLSAKAGRQIRTAPGPHDALAGKRHEAVVDRRPGNRQ